jgi:hypothetical protein
MAQSLLFSPRRTDARDTRDVVPTDHLGGRLTSRGFHRGRCFVATAAVNSSAFTLTLSEDERVQLLSLLEQAIRDKHVEVHRTEAPDYRQHVLREEAVLQSVIDKLRRP